jgi:hypothetical protein
MVVIWTQKYKGEKAEFLITQIALIVNDCHQ